MPKNLVIVESPAKAKTLKKFLGPSYKIEASVGHVRDLPKSELGIDIENDFEPKYITIRGKGEVLAKLRKEVKAAERVFLATDPDREGEAISWHLMHALKLSPENAKRITFNEITKSAVTKSIKEAREIDMKLVDAQQARRELDRIVGYKIGPLLWKKVKRGLSAGRVQSVALKVICDREEEIENFQKEEYWTMDATLKKGKEKFIAKFYGTETEKLDIKSEEEAKEILKHVEKSEFIVKESKKGSRSRKAPAPFTTSTLQQEASKVLGFATAKTMMLAQQLYEGIDIKGEGTVGFVSYIRTDSMRISDDAFESGKSYLLENLGENYTVSEKPNHKSRSRAQDAHEAIRPTDVSRTPEKMKDLISKDLYKLYKLIWERFVASIMPPANYNTLSAKLSAGKYQFRANGSKLVFDGYLAIYKRNETSDAEAEASMPELVVGDKPDLLSVKPEQHFTQPPPRFSEAILVKTLEELGIGRPSTYSAIISTIIARRYVTKEAKVFYATELGNIVNNIMKEYFENIVDVEFTAKMEDELDQISEGDIEWKEVVRQFYKPFSLSLEKAEDAISKIEISPEISDVICEKCGKNMVVKMGRYGRFLACPGYPDCKNVKALHEEAGVNCPLCEAKVLIKKSKSGRVFYGCEKSPDCQFISWNKPTGEKCPVCNDFLVVKGTKNKKVVCNNTSCKFEKPLEEN